MFLHSNAVLSEGRIPFHTYNLDLVRGLISGGVFRDWVMSIKQSHSEVGWFTEAQATDVAYYCVDDELFMEQIKGQSRRRHISRVQNHLQALSPYYSLMSLKMQP